MDWLSDLYREHSHRMYLTALRVLRDQGVAEDVMHNVFVKALAKEMELQTHENIAGWLFVTLRNEIGNVLQKKAAHPIISIDEQIDQFVMPEPNAPLADSLPRELKEDDRIVLLARYEYGQSYEEMSTYLGIDKTACRARVSRAKRRLKRILTDEGHVTSSCIEPTCKGAELI